MSDTVRRRAARVPCTNESRNTTSLPIASNGVSINFILSSKYVLKYKFIPSIDSRAANRNTVTIDPYEGPPRVYSLISMMLQRRLCAHLSSSHRGTL